MAITLEIGSVRKIASQAQLQPCLGENSANTVRSKNKMKFFCVALCLHLPWIAFILKYEHSTEITGVASSYISGVKI